MTLPTRFDMIAAQPQAWFFKAATLKQAADVLWRAHVDGLASPPNHSLPPEVMILQPQRVWPIMMIEPYGLMAGFAIENLLKGILVAVGPTTFITAKGRYDWPGKRQHELRPLAAAANLVLSAKEEQLLARLEVAVDWTSRYPTPSSRDWIAGGSDSGIPVDEWETFDALNNQLARRLWEAATGTRWHELTGL